jgi:eukaryotic-like serine/threonine-protein kinase
MPQPAHTVRFGPFQLDLLTAELHNNGVTTRLADQPFHILVELVEHPGEVVTREQLRQRLWRSDTFVDFEHGLNTAVKRLRSALGDSAENPRYIETLPRHGYRLMVPVERPEPVLSVIPKTSNRRIVVPVVMSLIAVAIAGMLYLWWRHADPPLTDRDTVILSDFDNKTGDAVFDDTLKQGLETACAIAIPRRYFRTPGK